MAGLIQTVDNFYVARFTSGAAVTLVLYDFMLVFEQELATIYRAKWSIPKFLFFFIRIMTPPGVILGTMQRVDFRPGMSRDRYLCIVVTTFLIYAMLTSIFAAHSLFTFRLIALYRSQKYMVWFISVFCVATYLSAFGLVIGGTFDLMKFPAFYSEPFKSCISLGTSPLLPPIWYAPLAYETFLFGLTAYRAWYDASVISGKRTPVLALFYRDGIIAFLVMTGARIWNIYIYVAQPGSSVYIGTMLMWALNIVLTTRVYTNLVSLANRPIEVTGEFTGASIGFQHHGTFETSGNLTTIEMHTPAREGIRDPSVTPIKTRDMSEDRK
ncbi:hypothetical protein M408DRAFT_26275 [Serendipita vermifera MAFF 305830]|uniref:DUF6533 domain-containing protein n=1 Tax=Serendipita vermifera MAFF 305830 TaxID=933852 RepID=A0A0C3AZ82_SERVB|nr:hypothetical protein M408DRAFT_26275 [Serendipita vermifera MAFF 305830]